MGENPHRKMPNVLAEMFMPYEPADYSGVVGGDRAVSHDAVAPEQA
jgi:hypothetical protein